MRKLTTEESWVPLNDPARFWLEREETVLTEVAGCLQRGASFAGSRSALLRLTLSGHLHKEHVILCGNGTDALRLAMASVGVRPGSGVVTVANAGGYTTTAARQLGAEVRLVDIDASTLQMSPERLAIELKSQPVDVVVLTHLFGNVSGVASIRRLCEEAGVVLVEDCAQALGPLDSTWQAGAIGEIATLSFYPTKNVSGFGDGGALATNSNEIAVKASELAQYGWSERYLVTRSGGTNSRMDELQAALIQLSLEAVGDRAVRRRAIANRYSQALGEWHSSRTPSYDASVHHLYPVIVDDRARFTDLLSRNRISWGIHSPVPDHLQPAWRSDFASVSLPVTELACSRLVSLPLFAEMSEAEISRVCAVLSQFSQS